MSDSEPFKHCLSCGQMYPLDYAVCPRCATPLARPDDGTDPLLGTVLGDTYEIEKLLGEGGMGRVYRARHVRLGRGFAIKVLHRMFCADRDQLHRFRQEAVAASAIVSPYVAQVVDVNATREGQPYLVSELLEGEDLSTVLEREGSLPVGRAVTIGRQVARGLAAAHAAGVVHRDLKPENVMLVKGADGRELAKVLDFGIAKTAGDAHLTRTGTVLGTPAYMAPEQARGGVIDQRCDIYSLGAVLYRALTGRAAFTGDDPGRTITSVIHDEPERPRTLRKDLPDALELVVQRAMAKDPAHRYATMIELDQALQPFENVVGARPPPPPSDVGRAVTVAVVTGQTERPPSGAFAAKVDVDGALARYARPRALAYGATCLAWCLVLLHTLIGRTVATVTMHALNPIERILVVALSVALAAPLAVLEVRRLSKGSWRNTATMLARGDAFGRAALLSLAAYALVSAPARLWQLFQPAALEPQKAEWVALALSLLVGGFALLRPRR